MGEFLLSQEEPSIFSARPSSQTSRNSAGPQRTAPALTDCSPRPARDGTGPVPLPHWLSCPAGLPLLLGKKRADVLSHSAVPRNDVGPAPLEHPPAHCRCSRSHQRARRAFSNMWEVISHNFLCICMPASVP